MNYQTLIVSVDGARATVTFNRPQALNALTRQMRSEFIQALDLLAEDTAIRAVILTGAGRAFSVGQDVQEMAEDYAQAVPQMGRLVREEYIPMVKRLRALPKPTVALLHGPAAGGGMALALAADFRLMTEKSTLFPAFVKVGLAPDTGCAFFLTRMVGLARATHIALSGNPIRATDAYAWGLAQGVYPTLEAAQAEAERLADELSQGPTMAYLHIRQLLDQAAGLPLADVLPLEAQTQEFLGGTHDHQEAVAAFLAKRPPQFLGR